MWNVREENFISWDRKKIICGFSGNNLITFRDNKKLFLIPRHKFGPCWQEMKNKRQSSSFLINRKKILLHTFESKLNIILDNTLIQIVWVTRQICWIRDFHVAKQTNWKSFLKLQNVTKVICDNLCYRYRWSVWTVKRRINWILDRCAKPVNI